MAGPDAEAEAGEAGATQGTPGAQGMPEEAPPARIRPLGAPTDILRPTGRVAARRDAPRGVWATLRGLFRRP